MIFTIALIVFLGASIPVVVIPALEGKQIKTEEEIRHDELITAIQRSKDQD